MKFFSLQRPKIAVFVRHCFYSNASAHKLRPKGFSHEKCYENFLKTFDQKKGEATFLLDTHFAKGQRHFVQNQSDFPVVEINAGEEGKSFLVLLEYVMSLRLPKETIVYFLEDDYLHREGWVDRLLEGFSLQAADYITLFDHRDKYFLPQYQELKSQIFHTPSCHWRTTLSTTNTFATKLSTLMEDFEIHQKYSLGHKITLDHDKFIELQNKGRTLISSIPGWSTHCEPEFASPTFDWSSLFKAHAVQ